MKPRFDLPFFAVMSLFASSITGYAMAQGDDSAVAPSYVLAKAGGASNLAACKAQCRKAYRRCYSQGNQVGKPDVSGGEPCSEQKVMCLRACQQ